MTEGELELEKVIWPREKKDVMDPEILAPEITVDLPAGIRKSYEVRPHVSVRVPSSKFPEGADGRIERISADYRKVFVRYPTDTPQYVKWIALDELVKVNPGLRVRSQMEGIRDHLAQLLGRKPH